MGLLISCLSFHSTSWSCTYIVLSSLLKQNKPWFDEECLGFLEQRKWAKMQWIQDPSQSKLDNLNSVRREVSRHFRNKKEGISES